jgi:hypothetical protein
MFRALQPGTLIDDSAGRLVALYRSTNTPSMGIGGGPGVPARAHVLGFSRPEGKYRAFVYFGATITTSDAKRTGLLFASQPAELRFDQLDRSIQEAMHMVKEQGFEMEKLEYASMDAAARQQLQEYLPLSDSRLNSRPPTSSTGNLPPVGPSAPPLSARVPSGMFQAPVGDAMVGFHTGHFENAVDISREISLPSMQAVDTLVRMLSLF